MKPKYNQILEAALKGDIKKLREYAVVGADFNEIKDNESLLDDVLLGIYCEEPPFKYEVIKELIALGAKPDITDSHEETPLYYPIIAMDTEMIKILLEAGADPNKSECFSKDETLYDWADFEYRDQVYDLKEPEKPSDEDKKNEEAWLQYLDRMALKYKKPRPDYLFLLRKYGAKTTKEQNTEKKNVIK